MQCVVLVDVVVDNGELCELVCVVQQDVVVCVQGQVVGVVVFVEQLVVVLVDDDVCVILYVVCQLQIVQKLQCGVVGGGIYDEIVCECVGVGCEVECCIGGYFDQVVVFVQQCCVVLYCDVCQFWCEVWVDLDGVVCLFLYGVVIDEYVLVVGCGIDGLVFGCDCYQQVVGVVDDFGVCVEFGGVCNGMGVVDVVGQCVVCYVDDFVGGELQFVGVVGDLVVDQCEDVFGCVGVVVCQVVGDGGIVVDFGVGVGGGDD